MIDDLDDLLDDNVPMTKPTTVAQRNKSAAIGRFGGNTKKDDDLDDLGDSFNFDDIGGMGGNSKPVANKKGSMSFGGGLSSAQNKYSRPANEKNDDSFFGVGKKPMAK